MRLQSLQLELGNQYSELSIHTLHTNKNYQQFQILPDLKRSGRFLSRPVARGGGEQGHSPPLFSRWGYSHRPGHIIRDRNKKIKKNEMKNERKEQDSVKIRNQVKKIHLSFFVLNIYVFF